MNTLQKALIYNAIFSFICGICLVLFHQQIAGLFGLETSTAFWIIGITLFYFVITLVYEMKRQRFLAVSWIIIQDILWVLGSIFLLILQPFGITATGNWIIAVVAIGVLFIAINQFIALKGRTGINTAA